MRSLTSAAFDQEGDPTTPMPAALETPAAVFDPARLLDVVAAAFAASGATPDDARVAADVLVSTDLRGTHSHGTQTLPIHLDTLENGGARSPVQPTTVRSGPTTAVLDGQGGIGLVVATRAVAAAIDLAADAGVGIVLVRGSNHFGAAGHYALAAAAAGFIGLATSNTSPIMTAAGSRGKAIGNAPLAYAVPAPDFPLCLDIAMSATAGMKVRAAAAAGRPIPTGWVVDAEGRDTTDPQDYLHGGALLPFAGHKGYGLAVLVEVLAGALSGAGMLSGVVPWLVHTDRSPDAGHAFLVIDPERFLDRAEFHERMARLVEELRSAEPAPGMSEVLVPGELEHRAEQRARRHGVPLPAATLHRLEQAVARHDLADQLAAARTDGR